MQINSVKLISLLFFILSAFYLYTAHQIQVFAFDEDAPFNAKTFPIYLGYAGMFFSGLKLILPDPNTIKVDHKNLEYKKTGILIVIAIIYGATNGKEKTLKSIFVLLKNSMTQIKIKKWSRNNLLLKL